MQQNLNLTSTENKSITVLNELKLSYIKSDILKEGMFQLINSSYRTTSLLRKIWDTEISIKESFYIICFNTAMNVVGYRKIADGGLDAVMVDLRLLFSTALLCNSHSMIIAHNHPSGTLQPSSADLRLTENIKKACAIFNIKLLDHIILTDDSFYSMADNGDL